MVTCFTLWLYCGDKHAPWDEMKLTFLEKRFCLPIVNTENVTTAFCILDTFVFVVKNNQAWLRYSTLTRPWFYCDEKVQSPELLITPVELFFIHREVITS